MTITFKNFLEHTQFVLHEGVVKRWDIKEANVSKAIEMLNTHCKDGLKAISTGGVLWRGWGKGKMSLEKYKDSPVIVDTTNSLRTSRDYDNLYMLLMNASEHFKDIPSRSNSLICSTSYQDANNYAGNQGPSAIIPFDGTKVMFVPKTSDFNEVQLSSVAARKLFLNGTFTDAAMRDFLDAVAKPVKIKTRSGATKSEHAEHTAIDVGMSRFSINELTLLFVVNALHYAYAAADELISASYKNDDANKMIDKFDNVSIRHISDGKWANKNSKERFDSMLQMIETGDVKFIGEASFFYKLIEKAPKNARFTTLASSIVKPKDIRLKTVTFGQKLPSSTECWVSGKFVVIPAHLFNRIVAQLSLLNHPIHPYYKQLASSAIKMAVQK